MLEYYKLMLVRAGEDRREFQKELRKALADLEDPEAIASLKEWYKNRLRPT
ncbi:MAG: hypothetical protein HKN79_01070 [Flavobacteriales bacterium]|nr:hypothetical protein [Flavobacteriales bacterium]